MRRTTLSEPAGQAGGTLFDVLLSAAEASPDQVIVQVDSLGRERALTYAQLLDDALVVAGGFAAAGLTAGMPVIVLPESSQDFLASFWGALAAGLVPVPLAPVPEKVLAVWVHLLQPPLVVTPELEPLVRRSFAAAGSPGVLQLLSLATLREGPRAATIFRPAATDLAFLQFSSGSTGTPKGIELTHNNVLANIDQARRAGLMAAGDVIVSWMPYFHDMGLIGAHLAPLAVRIKQVKLEPNDFGKRPALWYETAARHRATVLPMASFALALTLKRVSSDEVAALDLSSVRLVGVGAEPIPVPIWRRFLAHLSPARLDPSALVPLYGLAEATLAVALPPIGEVARPLALDRAALARGRAVDAYPTSSPADVAGASPVEGVGPAEFMDVGLSVPGGELRIVGDDGETLGDSLIGQIEFRGPNVARGYHSRADETAATFSGGWLRTGDLGFLRRGRLCVTGRAKDVLFVHGQKYHAHDVEQVVANTPGVPFGRVAVIGFADRVSGAERVVVFVSSRETPVADQVQALSAVRVRVREALAYDDVVVLPIPPEEFPRTTSGKVQRAQLRDRAAAGAFASLEAEIAELCDPATIAPSIRPQPPRYAIEAQIAAIWSDVLGVPAGSIDRHDRFLAIGGSSLTAMQVLGKLEQAFGGPLEPAVLRDCPTVAAQAEHLLARRDPPRDQLPPVSRTQAGQAAIIALACRFPNADTPEAFWANLVSGRDSVTEVPESRWIPRNGARARWGAFLDDVAGFDADFFGVEPEEAVVMDPHARIFLEVAHEALERAGYAGERRQGRRIGVFVAVGESGYAQLLSDAINSGAPVSAAALVGNLRSLIAARVAHFLDLSGPVMAVDTACSSALVALHLARRSLETGECDLAVVGGVSLNLTPTAYQLLEAAQALSATGRCRAFSSDADGFVPGEGAAAIVLEPLARAQDAGDRVLAVVRGSAVNNDGRSLSLLAPNPLLQQAVIADAYREAGIDPRTVSYVEAHGTGTAIGDPIEARSLMQSFPAGPGLEPRWLGTAKTNIGHLLNAAGMPSLLKVALSLQHAQLPPSLHYAESSPEFDLAASGFAVVTELRDWQAPSPRRAGINGFGFGGTNAHVILEEAPRRSPAAGQRKPTLRPHLLTLSAASEPALRQVVTDVAVYARIHPDADLGDLCASVSTARDDGRYRLAVVVRDDLATQLESHTHQSRPLGAPAGRCPRVVWMFPGQGAQLPGMGRALHVQPAYQQTMADLSAAVGPLHGRTLLQWSLDPDVQPAELGQTAVAQPLLVAFGISLAAELRAWGLQSDALLGHSVGELAAAAVSGALTPVEAVRLAAERGRVMQERCAPGAMAAVLGAEALVSSVVADAAGELSLAAVNGAAADGLGHYVISGLGPAVDAALAVLSRHGCRGRRLEVSHAFHSSLMAPALDALRATAAAVRPQPHQIPLLSTVTGEWSPTFDATYLADHVRQPVLFCPAVQRLVDDGYDTFLEVGPGATLSSLVRSIARAGGHEPEIGVFAALEGSDREDAERASSAPMRTVGRLWARGASISRRSPTPGRRRLQVPTYPFQRTRYWLPEVADRSLREDPVPVPVSHLLHRFVWEESPLPAGAVLRSVCIVGDHPQLAAELSDRLAKRGVQVHVVSGGMLDQAPPPSVLLLLAGPAVDLDCVDTLDAVARDAVAAMLDVARFLQDSPTPLIVVTEDVALTGAGAEQPRPGQALFAGLASALPNEIGHQAVRMVDLSSRDDADARIHSLISELDAPPTVGPAPWVAWRAGRRLAKAPVLDQVLRPDRSSSLPAEGCYLITGGAGGVGGSVARFLAGRGRSEIFLVGRSRTVPTGLLDEIEELGAKPHYIATDLSVESEVERMVAALPRLDGIFHAAGILGAGELRSTPMGEIEEVLAPKVRGTFLLTRALERAGRRPDTFVGFSSIASALPGYAGGLGGYAAGNAFLDAYALAETQAGRHLQVLNFAAWTDTGMAASAAFRVVAGAKSVPQLTVAQALDALCDATSLDIAQLLVLDADRQAPPVAVTPAADDVATRTPLPHPTRDRTRADTPVRAVVARLIAAELRQRPEDIDDDASLLAMGLDSLAAVDLVRKLEHELGRALPTTLIFEHPSIAQLSAYLTGAPSATHVAQPTQVAQPSQVAQPTQGPAAAGAMQPDYRPLPLTPVQLAFHTNGRLYPEVAAYAYLRQTVVGSLDEEILARSFAFLERRHPMLRMRISPDRRNPRQLIQPPVETDRPDWFDTARLGVSAPDRAIEAVEDELCNRVFRLAEEPGIRAVLLREDPDRAYLLIVLHHAVADGASLNILGGELWQVYTTLCQGRPPELAPLRSGFRDYVDCVEHLRTSSQFEDDLRYWRGSPAIVRPPQRGSLPCDGDPHQQPSGPMAARQLVMSAALTQALQARAAELDVSFFHLVLTGYVRRLAAWGDQQEVTVDVARAGRDARLPDIGLLVGPFADTLPLTVSVPATGDVAALAQDVRAGWLKGERHGSVTTLDLARMLPTMGAAPRTAGSAGFSFARFPLELPPGCPVRITGTAARTASAATRLGLVCWEFGGVLQLSWNYPVQLFSAGTIDRISVELLAELASLAGGSAPPAQGTSVVERIRAQCRRTPEAVAVEAGDDRLTYAELDSSAERLAAVLRRRGVVENDRVALLTAPGVDTVVALLGVLQAGATWVPLDSAHPSTRLADQAARAGVIAVVCSASTREVAARLASPNTDDVGATHLKGIDLSVVDLSVVDPDAPPTEHPDPGVGPDDIAYIIFTSGTTGHPKGVPITHAAMTTYLDWAISTFSYNASDRLAATASSCFDASVRQLLAPLLVGATIVAIPRDILRDPQALLTTVERQRVTVWSSVPTLWEQLLRAAERAAGRTGMPPDLSALRWVHVGGEPLSPDQVRRWFDLFGPGQRIVNLYGPTEATINAAYEVISSRPHNDVTRLPIGWPVAQTMVDVVSEDGASCGVGEPGELFLAGPGLTAGYLGDPDLTAEAFVDRGGLRYYRTGDRVVHRADGKLEFLGRTDEQVKIRGHRVEPGEIEVVLQRHPGVQRAVVLADAADPQRTRLIAYVQATERVPAAESWSYLEELRAHLASSLPDYMIPGQLLLVDAMPVTPAGKLDRTSLPGTVQGAPVPGRVGTAAVTETEQCLAAAWSGLLGVEPVFREDDFFALGGDSIGVLEVFARLEAQLPSVPAPTLMYRHRTLAGLAEAIDLLGSQSRPEAGRPADTGKPFALTPAQRGFLLAEALSPGARASWVACFRLKGPLDTVLFSRAVALLVDRHLMLRVVIAAESRPPTQQEVPAPAVLQLNCEDVDPAEVSQRIAEERDYRFDSSRWPLVRLRLLRLDPEEHAFVVHAHHLVGDGYSVVLLAQDLMALYDGLVSRQPPALPQLRSTVRDYAQLVEGLAGSDLPTARRADDPAPYTAPLLRRTTPVGSPAEGVLGAVSFTVDRGTTSDLRRRGSAAGATPYAALLTAYYRALARLTGQHDLLLGVAVTGRDYPLPDIARVVGPLAGIQPVRLRPAGHTFEVQLRQVARAVTAARTDGDSMQQLFRASVSTPQLASVGAQFLFSYLDFDALGPITSKTIRLTWDEAGTDLEPPPIGTDLLLTIRPIDGTLQVTLRCSAGVLEPQGLRDFADDLRRELVSFARSRLEPSTRTARPDVLDAAIVGYLPAPRDLATLAGIEAAAGLREGIRGALFPDGRARLLEELTTPLGRSGFVCLPIFADELPARGGETLGQDAARAVELATGLGARCVSLAGMIPAHTAYGFDVVKALPDGASRVTTGHATTAASVVKTVLAALAETGGDLSQLTVAIVGLGSIGRSTLELLLALGVGCPRRLLLCDVVSRAPHLAERAGALRDSGFPGDIATCGVESSLPGSAYEADVLIAAISADRPTLDIDRLRPGTIVVDDSFPHCFDPGAAVRRMEATGDVLVVGGGLLTCSPVEQQRADDPVLHSFASQLSSLRLRDTVASCQLESLLQADRPDLPLVHGLVDVPLALAYWDALSVAGVEAAPLHLLQHVVSKESLGTLLGSSSPKRSSAVPNVEGGGRHR